jgi:glycosyltransferase involved in cell wall biosynthesis
VRVLALTKYGTVAASTRQRFVQYEPVLKAAGIEVSYAPFFDNGYVQKFMDGEARSLISVGKSYWRRLRDLASARKFELLWVYCELFPYLPVEWLARVINRPIVFDYDDAIFHIYDNSRSMWVRHILSRKLQPLLKIAKVSCCGNKYLQDYAARFSRHTIILPTVVDTSAYLPAVPNKTSPPIVIGWSGSPTTWENVRPLLPMLRAICEQGLAQVRVIGEGAGAEQDQFPGLELVSWSAETEVNEIQQMDIGIMPLLDLPFQRGKSGYKLIQYMACGVPVIASPIGVNAEIVSHGGNGYLATTVEEWRRFLLKLIHDGDHRHILGAAGRERVVSSYSLQAHAPRLVEAMRMAAS